MSFVSIVREFSNSVGVRCSIIANKSTATRYFESGEDVIARLNK